MCKRLQAETVFSHATSVFSHVDQIKVFKPQEQGSRSTPSLSWVKSNLPWKFQADPFARVDKLFALSQNGEKSKYPILDLDADTYHHQNHAHSELGQSVCSSKISSS